MREKLSVEKSYLHHILFSITRSIVLLTIVLIGFLFNCTTTALAFIVVFVIAIIFFDILDLCNLVWGNNDEEKTKI